MLVLLPYQSRAVHSPARFTWHCWARQTGKSFTLGLRRLLRGLQRRRTQIVLSAGQRQSREVIEKIRGHCFALKIWHEFHDQRFFRRSGLRQFELLLPGDIRIIALPANPLTARGYSGDVFLDEFAMHRDDEAIWAALFPTLLRSEGELDVSSTPRGQSNTFARLRENQRFERTTVTLEEAVAEGLDVDVGALRAGIGDEFAWRQEFCCEFADEASRFLPYEVIRGCQDSALSVQVDWGLLADRRAELYLGVDVGRLRDLTVLWVWQPQGEAFVTRGVLVMRRAAFAEQEAAIARMLRCPGLRRCVIDATGLGLQLAERLEQEFGDHRVERMTLTAALKSQLAGQLRVLAEAGRLRIPVDEAIAGDWHSVTRVIAPGGSVRFDAARSGDSHADRFWAAALGLHAASSPTGELGVLTSGPLAFERAGIW